MLSVQIFYAMQTNHCLNDSFISKSENPLVLSAQRGLDGCKLIVISALGWDFNQTPSLILVLCRHFIFCNSTLITKYQILANRSI